MLCFKFLLEHPVGHCFKKLNILLVSLVYKFFVFLFMIKNDDNNIKWKQFSEKFECSWPYYKRKSNSFWLQSVKKGEKKERTKKRKRKKKVNEVQYKDIFLKQNLLFNFRVFGRFLSLNYCLYVLFIVIVCLLWSLFFPIVNYITPSSL